MSVDVCTPLGSLNDIRRVAREAGMTEIQLNKTSRVIAFRGSRHYALYPRINVWYTTGTVGTYLYHPNSEASTQLFRRMSTYCFLRISLQILENTQDWAIILKKNCINGDYRIHLVMDQAETDHVHDHVRVAMNHPQI
eukprot:456548_1